MEPVFTFGHLDIRIDVSGVTCMATDDGVACVGSAGGPPQGFQVTSSETTTFGG